MKNKLPFRKRNYQIMIIGLLVIALGFTIMSMDTDPHGFGFLGLTLGPIIVLVGFMIEIVAVLYSTDKSQDKSQ